MKKLTSHKNISMQRIDNDFIYISDSVLKKSELKVVHPYQEIQEPKIIKEFDYEKQKQSALTNVDWYIQNNKSRLHKLDSIYDKIFYVMKSIYFRKGSVGKTKFDENKEIFRPLIMNKLRKQEPLEVVLPSFPFKLPNLLKVSRRSPDMAEILCLSRLYEICMTIQYIYPPGVKFIIISDGQVYHQMFGVSRYEALHYRDESIRMIEKLQFANQLQIVDMQDLVNCHVDEFRILKKHLHPIVKKWWDTEAGKRRLSLLNACAYNINNRFNGTHDLLQLSLQDMLNKLNNTTNLANLNLIRNKLLQRTEHGAFEYALFLYTLKEMNLLKKIYPESIRATVHPKPGQWGIHLVNEKTHLLPWHGIAYKKANGKWRIHYEIHAIRNNAIPVHLENDMYPFYYEEKKG